MHTFPEKFHPFDLVAKFSEFLVKYKTPEVLRKHLDPFTLGVIHVRTVFGNSFFVNASSFKCYNFSLTVLEQFKLA